MLFGVNKHGLQFPAFKLLQVMRDKNVLFCSVWTHLRASTAIKQLLSSSSRAVIWVIDPKWLYYIYKQLYVSKGCVCLSLSMQNKNQSSITVTQRKLQHWGQKCPGHFSLTLGNPGLLHYLQQMDLKALVYCARESNGHKQLAVW